MIFHLGAISTTTERDVDLILANNWRCSVDLWQQAAQYDLRLIYASSGATYGDGAAGFDDDPAALPRLAAAQSLCLVEASVRSPGCACGGE